MCCPELRAGARSALGVCTVRRTGPLEQCGGGRAVQPRVYCWARGRCPRAQSSGCEAERRPRSGGGTWRARELRSRPGAVAGRPGWARGSRPPPGAAEQPGHRGPAECRSRHRGENLCQWPCPGAEPSAKLSTRGPACARGRPGPHSPSARSSQRAPDKMARPVRGALGAPRRLPCPLLLGLLLLLRLEPATAEAGPRAPCAAACTCAGDSLDCGGRGLAALPGDLPAWTRSL